MYVLYQNPNFLIFDEPTNDLDLPTLTVLENFLLQFQGCLIIVSHDRYFMDRIVDHVLAFEGKGKIKNFVGNFTEYREWKKTQDSETKKLDEAKSKVSVEPVSAPSQPKVSKKKLSFKEQRELELLEKEMPELEKKRDIILEALNNETDYDKIAGLSKDLEVISENLETSEMRWLELQEMLES